jgi:hypothetical protein
MTSLTEVVASQNQRLAAISSVYRFELVSDGLVDLVDIQGQPAYDDPEARYIDPSELVEYTSHLIAAELSCR